ncbi:MAG: hypothetical protein OHK93_001605 [Ramalina farinacea]|uniref:Swi5-dependent recombination DNA repair protein 1 n=1 Tax=Ramalina farinacea TaxID=258253 RepID=A0AA43QQR3_9LECA|nr:hypothetical protein [Ramalina farinacea]
MSSTPRPPKRPRLNNNNSISASTLRAPFKSPLRPRDSNAPAASSTLPHKNAFSPAAKQTTATTHTVQAGTLPSSKTHTQVLTPPNKKIDHAPPTTTTNPEAPAPSEPDPAQDLPSLQRTHTALLNTLAARKRDLEIATQAQKLERSSIPHPSPSSTQSRATEASSDCAENERLRELIASWKSAGRDAADAVFVSAKAKVEGMGGVKGMRRREVERWKWLREEERAERDVEREKGRRERDGGGDEDEVGDDGEGEREREEEGVEEEEDEGVGEYTMGMMLQGFGIDPKCIGWDEAGGKWID